MLSIVQKVYNTWYLWTFIWNYVRLYTNMYIFRIKYTYNYLKYLYIIQFILLLDLI